MDDLPDLGSVQEIIEALNKSMVPFSVDVSVDSYDGLLPYVIRAKKTERFEPTEFFISKRHELIYILTQHSHGAERKEKLGCRKEYFEPENNKKARNWFNKLAKTLNAQSKTNAPSDDIVKLAFQRLSELKRFFTFTSDLTKQHKG